MTWGPTVLIPKRTLREAIDILEAASLGRNVKQRASDWLRNLERLRREAKLEALRTHIEYCDALSVSIEQEETKA